MALCILLLPNFSFAQHGTGAAFLSDAQYASLPRPNWDTLKKYSNIGAISIKSGVSGGSGITQLNNPPIGDQGILNSCVGWAVGYSAMGILSYPKFNCWNMAERSPIYVYNQIKQSNVCASAASGSYTTDGLNLVQNQGDCSWNLFPYIFGITDCNTPITTIEKTEAAQNKAVKWAALNKNDVIGIKQALDLGFPVVIGFNVYSTFFTNTGTWTQTTGNTGDYQGGHAICIIGYNDITQSFLAQNQWGTVWGANGYVSISYNVVQNNGLREAYILYGTYPTAGMSINGPASTCTSSNYTIANLPTGSSVVWKVDNTSVATVNSNGVLTRVSDGVVTMTAIVTVCGSQTPFVIPPFTVNIGKFVQGYYNIVSSSSNSNNNTLNNGGGSVFVAKNQSASFSLQLTTPNLTSVSWSVSGNYSSYTSGSAFFNLWMSSPSSSYQSNNAIVTLNAQCPCGPVTQSWNFQVVASGSGSSYSMIASPNPAKGIINLGITKMADTTTNVTAAMAAASNNSTGITKIYLYDLGSGRLMKQWTFHEMQTSNYSLNFSNIKTGTYVLKMERDNKITTTKILVQ